MAFLRDSVHGARVEKRKNAFFFDGWTFRVNIDITCIFFQVKTFTFPHDYLYQERVVYIKNMKNVFLYINLKKCYQLNLFIAIKLYLYERYIIKVIKVATVNDLVSFF